MLVWVGADMAGDTLVVWEAEAGPIALDPITALEGGQDTGSVPGKCHATFPPLIPLSPQSGSELLLPLPPSRPHPGNDFQCR
jgi:hypothetical protein